MKLTFRFKGGPGSGAHGHKGIPGHQGGGLPLGESHDEISKPKNSGEFTSPEDLVSAFKKGKASNAGWQSLKVNLDYRHEALSQTVSAVDIDGKKYALIARHSTNYVNVKNSRLRDTAKTGYNSHLFLQELVHPSYDPEKWITGNAQFTISGISIKGEGRDTDDRLDAHKAKVLDLYKMNTGNDKIHWFYT